jgi:hypothetical protein
MMRDHEELGPIDRGLLANGWCADCGKRLIQGPRGGAAQNFYCIGRETCRQGFNLTFHGNQLVFSERIGEVDDERFAMYSQ